MPELRYKCVEKGPDHPDTNVNLNLTPKIIHGNMDN